MLQACTDKCPVCRGGTAFYGHVDFNMTCNAHDGYRLPPSGHNVAYRLCRRCHFCFAPEMYQWSLEEFENKIYNKSYVRADPNYLTLRPRSNAQRLKAIFAGQAGRIRHLDYGGGNGELSRCLREAGWNSTFYDPFVDRDKDLKSYGVFDLITAYEVFEHVPDIEGLMENLRALLAPRGIILLSTLISDMNIKPGGNLDWWYVAPRNGHISIFSQRSLRLLAKRHKFKFGSLNDDNHVLWRRVPDWGKPLVEAADWSCEAAKSTGLFDRLTSFFQRCLS